VPNVQEREGGTTARDFHDPDFKEELTVNAAETASRSRESSVMRVVRTSARLVFGLLLTLFPSALRAQETGATVILRGTLTDNVYVAGGTVDVLADFERDLVGAGGTWGPRDSRQVY
jgi:hypothetical protein